MKKLKFIFITFIVYSISLFILRAKQKKKCNKICWLSVKLNRKGALARDVPFVHSFILHSIFNFFLFMARNNWILWRFQMKKKSNSFLLVLMKMGVLQHTVLYSLTFCILYRIYQFIGYVLNAIFKDYSLCSIYVYIHKNIRSKL